MSYGIWGKLALWNEWFRLKGDCGDVLMVNMKRERETSTTNVKNNYKKKGEDDEGIWKRVCSEGPSFMF